MKLLTVVGTMSCSTDIMSTMKHLAGTTELVEHSAHTINSKLSEDIKSGVKLLAVITDPVKCSGHNK